MTNQINCALQKKTMTIIKKISPKIKQFELFNGSVSIHANLFYRIYHKLSSYKPSLQRNKKKKFKNSTVFSIFGCQFKCQTNFTLIRIFNIHCNTLSVRVCMYVCMREARRRGKKNFAQKSFISTLLQFHSVCGGAFHHSSLKL